VTCEARGPGPPRHRAFHTRQGEGRRSGQHQRAQPCRKRRPRCLLVAFHAAERTGKEPKRHASVQRQFHWLTRHDPAIPQSMRDFILRAYDFKTVADYHPSPTTHHSRPRRQGGSVSRAISHRRSRVATPLKRAAGVFLRVLSCGPEKRASRVQPRRLALTVGTARPKELGQPRALR
jgi:hypothetical protein